MVGVTGQLRCFAMQGIPSQADDTEQPLQPLPAALLRPVERRALWVGVDQRDALAAARPFAGEMQSERRLADAALLVEQRDDHGALPRSGGRLSAGVEKRGCVRK